jgi:hypothetical protein
MTNSPQTPPPSPEEQRIRQQLRKRIRQESTDEWIAIIVAFGTIGAILFWSLGIRRDRILSVGEGNIFLGSENIVGNNEDVGRLSLTDDELELGEPETLIIEREIPTTPLQDAFSEGIDIEELEIERSGRLDNFLSTAPITGSVETEVETELEIEPEVPISESEIETELEIEPERETPEAIIPETEEVTPEVVPEEAETPELEPEVAFADLSEDYWAYPFIQKLGEQEFLSPTTDNQFEPDDLITRAGMANLIAQAFEGSGTIETKDFQDIDDGNIIAEDIDRAVQSGFMKGYSEDEFRPAENIPRYQVLVALATGLGLEPSGDPVTILQEFSDRDRIPDWAISQVAAATEAGLTVNRPEFDLQSLNPEEPATRAEVAAMIYQALLQQGKVESIDSEYIVQP